MYKIRKNIYIYAKILSKAIDKKRFWVYDIAN